jgi:ribosome biogenesis GTPase
MAKKTRRRTQAGRSARGSSRRQRIHDEDSGLRRQKILRGSENEGAPPPEASRREEEGDVRTGRVVALRGREVVVAPGGGAAAVTCMLRKSTRIPHTRTSALAVGDVVRYLAEGAQPHVLTEVEPRRTRLARDRGGEEHVIAANVDLCVIVASADRPSFKPGLVDRFLVSAREGGLEPVLVINKSDLVSPSASAAMLLPYGPLGFPALAVSATTGDGLDSLRDVLRGRTSVFSGQSGVGKSSLLNQLVPDLDLRIADVYGSRGKGRHTTSSSTLYELPSGGAVIDTPGLRSFSMHAPSLEALHDFFPEIARAAESCRFADCRHRGDEGCEVRTAVQRGEVHPDRLESYLALRAEIEER